MHENGPPPLPRNTAANLFPQGLRRFLPLFAMIAISLAAIGYVSGIRELTRTPRTSVTAPPAASSVPAAVTYAELPTANVLPNAAWQQSLADLRYDRPGIFETVVRTEAMKLAALEDRARNRAYDGAPPTIPHPVEAASSTTCLVCHGEGLKVGDRVASKMSHALLTNCTQCHVEQAPTGLPFRVDGPENTFVGIYRAGPGERANPGAPPTIPHHTWMRENCSSCHGLVTRAGTRTTHPWLTNCSQCHAPSAVLDQVHVFGAVP